MMLNFVNFAVKNYSLIDLDISHITTMDFHEFKHKKYSTMHVDSFYQINFLNQLLTR